MIRDIKQRAKNSLNGQWGIAIGVTLLASIISGAAANAIPLIGTIFVSFPLTIGLALFFLKIGNRNGELDDLFQPFRMNFFEGAITMFLMQLYIFLWSLLLIIPGIVKSYSYALVPYILAESNNSITNNDAITRSREIMDGKKMDLFLLHLSFILWILLVIVTFGIAALWVMPYMYAAQAEFYKDIAGDVSRQRTELDPEPKDKDLMPESDDSWDF